MDRPAYHEIDADLRHCQVILTDIAHEIENLGIPYNVNAEDFAGEIRKLKAQRDDLLAACEAVEWVKDPEYNDKSSSGFGICYCPWCGNYENYGHDKNCQRQAAIARAKGGE